MRLIPFKFKDESENILEFTNQRFCFFYHYWMLIMSDHGRNIMDPNKFESHRTLLRKTIKFIKSDFKHSQGKYEKFFMLHEYFNPSNILLEGSVINTVISNTKQIRYLERGAKDSILQKLESISEFLFDEIHYGKKVARKLTELLCENNPVTDEVKNNIKFLINSLIIELYHGGYPVDFISKIPDVITFRDGMNDFPFPKTLKNFEYHEDKYNAYIKEHRATLELCISGIINLLERDKFEGYIVFKVFNLEINRNDRINIGRSVVYNPIKHSIAKQKHRTDEATIEEFYDLKQDQEWLFASRSKCNAFTPISLRFPLRSLVKRREVERARNEIISCLNHVCDTYRVRDRAIIRIRPDCFFLVDKDFHIRQWSPQNHGEIHPLAINKEDHIEKFYTHSIGLINKLDHSLDLHRKIRKIVDVNIKTKEDQVGFSFSDLWIAWEGLMDIRQLISLSTRCMRIRLSNSYLTDTIFLMNAYLRDHLPEDEKGRINLSASKMRKYGIELRPLKTPSVRKFKNQYEKLFTELDFPFLKLIKNDIDSFIKREDEFFKNLDKWVKNVIEEFYMERNAEVHGDFNNEFSALKLKNAVLRISKGNIDLILDSMNAENKGDIKLILKEIKRKAKLDH